MKIQAITNFYTKQKQQYKNKQNYFINPLKNDFVTFGAKPKIAIYVVDPNNNRKRYNSVSELIQDKNANFNTKTALQINFSKNSSGITQNHILIRADRVEYQDKFGNIKIDEEKFEEIKNQQFTKNRNLILINPDFSYHEFNSIRECAQHLNISDMEAYKLYTIPKNQLPSHIITDKLYVTDENTNEVNKSKVKEVYEREFRTKLEPIYSISENGEYSEFVSARHFASFYNIPINTITPVLNGINSSVQGFIVGRRKDIETQDENGNKTIDEKKLSSIYKKSYRAELGKFYAINIDGTYQAFNSIKECSEALGINNQNIKRVVDGKIKTTKGYTIVRAQDITTEKNGNKEIDLEKIKQVYKFAFDEEYQPIYAIDSKGNYQKFASVKHCSDELKILKHMVTKTLNGTYKLTNGYAIVPAETVEVTDKKGNKVVDANLIKQISKSIERGNKKTIFAISADQKIKKYDNIETWAKKRNVSTSQAYITLKEKRVTRDGYLIVEQDEILSTNEQGIRFIDKKKIKKLTDEHFSKTKQALYAIDKTGNYTQYKNALDCAKKMGIDVSGIYMSLKNQRKTYKSHVFVLASDIEEKTTDGKIKISTQKIKNLIQTHFDFKPRICAITKSGSVLTFNTIKECAKTLNISEVNIYKSLKEERKTRAGYVFAYEDKISTQNSDGELIIDENLVKKLVKKTFRTKPETPKQKTEQKYCIVNFETKKCKITTFNEAVEKLLGKKEEELDFNKNEIINKKYAIIPLAKIANPKGEVDKEKLKSAIKDFDYKKENSINPFNNEIKPTINVKQIEKIEPISKAETKGCFEYDEEKEEIKSITLPDLTSIKRYINYCLVDTETQELGFFSKTHDIVQALDVITPEFLYCAKMQKLIDNKYAIIYIKDVHDDSQNINSIDENKLKKEIIYFMHTSKSPTAKLDRSKIKLEPFANANQVIDFNFSEEKGEVTDIDISKLNTGKAKNCLVDFQNKKIGFFDYTGSLARGLKISYQELDEIREKNKLLDNRYGIFYVDDITSNSIITNKTIDEKKLRRKINDYISTIIATQKILNIFN